MKYIIKKPFSKDRLWPTVLLITTTITWATESHNRRKH